MRSRLRGALKRSRTALILIMLGRNFRSAVMGRLNPRRSVRLGDRHTDFSLDQSLEYVDWVVGDYERYGGLNSAALARRQVIELGPGDNLGVALRLLGMGAERVVSLDRFVTHRDPAQQGVINEAIAERMSGEERARLEGVLSDDGTIAAGQEQLVLIEGTPIEEAERSLQAGSFDFVISRAVLEHVYDMDAAFAAMDRLLAAGGTMAHKVDVSDHALFTEGGQNPLTFLTISDRVYEHMRRHTGFSNRLLVGYYAETLSEMGYEWELLASNVIAWQRELEPHRPLDGIDEEVDAARPLLDEIRPKLLERYAALADRELALSGFFIRATKR